MRLLGILPCLFLAVLSSPKVDANDTFKVSYYEHPAAFIFIGIIRETYTQLGIETEFVKLPSEQRLLMLNNGELDADFVARKNLNETYNSVVKVPVPLVEADLVIFCAQDLPCSGDILNDPLATIYADLGTLTVLNAVFGIDVQAQVGNLESEQTMTQLFESGRINYYVAEIVHGGKFQQINAPHNTHVIGTTEGYHHVHQRHAHLVPQIEKALLRVLKKD